MASKNYKQSAAKRARDAARQNTEKRKASRAMYEMRRKIRRAAASADKRGEAELANELRRAINMYGAAFKDPDTGESRYMPGAMTELTKAYTKGRKATYNTGDASLERARKAAEKAKRAGKATPRSAQNVLMASEISQLGRGNTSSIGIAKTSEYDDVSEERWNKVQVKAFMSLTSNYWQGSGLSKDQYLPAVVAGGGYASLEDAWNDITSRPEFKKAIDSYLNAPEGEEWGDSPKKIAPDILYKSYGGRI